MLSALLTCAIGLRVSSANKLSLSSAVPSGDNFLGQSKLAPTFPEIVRQWSAPTRLVTTRETGSDEARNPSLHAGSGAIFQVTEPLQAQ